MREILEKYCKLKNDYDGLSDKNDYIHFVFTIADFRYMNDSLVEMKLKIHHNNGFHHKFTSAEKLEMFFESLK